MSIFNNIDDIFKDVDKSIIQNIFDKEYNDMEWLEGEWLEYPYCKEVYAVIQKYDYEILIYGQKVADIITDIEISEVTYKGKFLPSEFFPKIYYYGPL